MPSYAGAKQTMPPGAYWAHAQQYFLAGMNQHFKPGTYIQWQRRSQADISRPWNH